MAPVVRRVDWSAERTTRRAAIADIKQDSNAYYAFHEKQTAFSADAIKKAHPVSQFPVEPLPLLGNVSSQERTSSAPAFSYTLSSIARST